VVLVTLFIVLFIAERSYVLQTFTKQNINELSISHCGVVLTGAPGRIQEAFEVMTRGKIDKLIISGVYKDTQLREIFPQLTEYPDVKSENIILEKISESTLQNAEQSLFWVKKLNCKTVLLMTSHLHMYRAYRTFRASFPVDIEISTYSIVNPAKADSEFAIFFETIKSLFYSIIVKNLSNI